MTFGVFGPKYWMVLEPNFRAVIARNSIVVERNETTLQERENFGFYPNLGCRDFKGCCCQNLMVLRPDFENVTTRNSGWVKRDKK